MNLLAKILTLFGASRVIHFGERPPYRVVATIDDPDNLMPVPLTVVSPEQFERAYEEYGRLGPSSTVPIEGRWIAAIPDVDRSKYAALKVQCDDVRWTAARWAEDIRCGRMAGNPVLERMIATKYPFLTKRAVSSTDAYAWFVTR